MLARGVFVCGGTVVVCHVSDRVTVLCVWLLVHETVYPCSLYVWWCVCCGDKVSL